MDGTDMKTPLLHKNMSLADAERYCLACGGNTYRKAGEVVFTHALWRNRYCAPQSRKDAPQGLVSKLRKLSPAGQ